MGTLLERFEEHDGKIEKTSMQQIQISLNRIFH